MLDRAAGHALPTEEVQRMSLSRLKRNGAGEGGGSTAGGQAAAAMGTLKEED